MKVLPDLKLFLTLVFLSLFLLLLDNFGFLKLPKSILQTLTIPIQYGFYQSQMSFKKQLEFILLLRRASLENKALRVQLGELLTENANLRKKMTETEDSLATFSKLNPQTYDLLPARIISLNRSITIDQGAFDGVMVGQAVVIKDNYLGQIKRVDAKVSEVLLLTDPDSKITVFSKGSSGQAQGILIGQFGSKILMDKILHQENVEVGDLVYSTGLEGKSPRGLIMGEVRQVYERQNEIFKQATVEPIFNLNDLNLVFIIRSS